MLSLAGRMEDYSDIGRSFAPRIGLTSLWHRVDEGRDRAPRPGGTPARISRHRYGMPSQAFLYLQTKFTSLSGQDPARIPYDPKAQLAEQVRQSFAVSLQNLGTDYLDCLVLHSPLPQARQSLEVWQTMESLVDARGVRQLGDWGGSAMSAVDIILFLKNVRPGYKCADIQRFFCDSLTSLGKSANLRRSATMIFSRSSSA